MTDHFLDRFLCGKVMKNGIISPKLKRQKLVSDIFDHVKYPVFWASQILDQFLSTLG